MEDEEGALQKVVMVIQARRRCGCKKQAHEMRDGLGPESGDMRCGGAEARNEETGKLGYNPICKL